MTTRRQFLASSSALFATWGLSGCGRAPGANDRPKTPRSGKDLRFVFIVNQGGWDITRVFTPELFGNPNVDLEGTAGETREGGIRFVDHPNRPSVREFFRKHNRQTLVVNGILVPSLAHDICERLVLTGTTADASADVPAFIAGDNPDKFTLPHLVINGPSFSGDFGTAVTRIDSDADLDTFLSGGILDRSDTPITKLSPEAEAIIDKRLQLRVQGRIKEKILAERAQKLFETYDSALDRARALKDLQDEIQWDRGGDLAARVDLALQALGKGISRCVTIATGGWDTHDNNDAQQTGNFEELFAGLLRLVDGLEATPGITASTLAKETVVVLVSEMGRTPKLNGGAGKDHWPYTSAMLVGPGLNSNRTIGGFDVFFNGAALNFRDGDVVRRGGTVLSSNSFCASILNLAGIDHRRLMPGVATFPALLG
jgi:hypothetical protein